MGENSDDQDTPAGNYFDAIEFVEYDNKHEFVRLFNRLESDYKELVIMEICYRDAANCLAAILDGEAGDECRTLYLSDLAENMPLHREARRNNPRITSLLLDKGFSADLRTDIDCPPICLKNALPLNVSLDYFRFRIWKGQPKKSPIYQIMDFCKMSSEDAITRVLARNTTEIKHEFFKYLKQGKVFEVGALLAIASDLIMSPSSTIDGENGGIGFKNIMEMRQFLLAEISQSLSASYTQVNEMKKTLRLLEIFDSIGDRLVLHMPMWDYSPRVSAIKVGVLIEEAASICDEKAEVEYDFDAVPSAYNDETTDDETILPDAELKTKLNISKMGENFDDQDTPCGFRYRAIEFVEYDNKHEFVRLINRVSSDDKESVIIEICHNDAANCLAAILDGEAGDECRTLYLSDVAENMPLHYAARKVNPRITSLLLDKGFSADLRANIDCPPFCLKNALPLNVSLDYFRFQIWELCKVSDSEFWKSPIYQIWDFCEMASNDATTRLIARKTTEIKHEFFKYLKQGKVFEVGALLAIASDLIMSSSSTIDGENGGIGFKNIMEMRQFLLAEISQSLNASNTQLKEMKKTLRLLEIFDRIGDRLVLHMPMWDFSPRVSGLRVGVLIEEAASICDEEAEVEYDHDAVPSAYYPPYLILSCDDETSDDETTLPDNVVKNTTVYPNIGWQNPDCTRSTIVFRSRGQNRNCTRKFSTKVHFPSWLKEGSSHDNAPLPLPTTLKATVTKHVLSKKHASFTGVLAKAVRRLRYF